MTETEHAAVRLPVTIRDLEHDDLRACAWAGSPLHLDSVARALDRAQAGEVAYLALCPPSGLPVALGGVDFAIRPDAGVLWQLAVHPALQSCGLGTLLIGALERRVRQAGRLWAELSVELSNPRARQLYARLGYEAYETRPEAWNQQQDNGTVVRYETLCAVMHRRLPRRID